ncbi:hypothetical protein SCA6_016279 [Theobroma cacao]
MAVKAHLTELFSLLCSTNLQGSGYPFLTNEEQAAAVGLAVKHELFLASLKKREALMPPKLFAPLKPLGGLGKRRPKES